MLFFSLLLRHCALCQQEALCVCSHLLKEWQLTLSCQSVKKRNVPSSRRTKLKTVTELQELRSTVVPDRKLMSDFLSFCFVCCNVALISFRSPSRTRSEDAGHRHCLGLFPALRPRQLHPKHGHPDKHVRQEVSGALRLRRRLVSRHGSGDEGLPGLRHLHQRAPLRVGAQHLELGLLQQQEHRLEDEPVALREDPQVLSHRGFPPVPGEQSGPLQDPAVPGLAAAVVQLHLQALADTGTYKSSDHLPMFLFRRTLHSAIM